jgi:hypothetical protein
MMWAQALALAAGGQHQPLQPGLLQGATACDGHGLGHRHFEGQGDVGLGLGIVTIFSQGVHGKGLEAAKAELQPWAIGHGTGEAEAPRSALLRNPGDGRTAGIAQPQQFGGLVEGLARGIIYRLAQ